MTWLKIQIKLQYVGIYKPRPFLYCFNNYYAIMTRCSSKSLVVVFFFLPELMFDIPPQRVPMKGMYMYGMPQNEFGLMVWSNILYYIIAQIQCI